MEASEETRPTPFDRPGAWWRPFPIEESWLFIAIVASALAMLLATIAWMVWGPTNVPDTTYKTTPAQFKVQVQKFTEKYEIAPATVRVPPGVTAYMLAQRYGFTPKIHAKVGQKLPIIISSSDVLHGFSLVGQGQNINIEVVPGYGYKLDFIPDKTGEYLIICNEFCGLGHQSMVGRIVIEK